MARIVQLLCTYQYYYYNYYNTGFIKHQQFAQRYTI